MKYRKAVQVAAGADTLAAELTSLVAQEQVVAAKLANFDETAEGYRRAWEEADLSCNSSAQDKAMLKDKHAEELNALRVRQATELMDVERLEVARIEARKEAADKRTRWLADRGPLETERLAIPKKLEKLLAEQANRAEEVKEARRKVAEIGARETERVADVETRKQIRAELRKQAAVVSPITISMLKTMRDETAARNRKSR